MIFYRYAAPMRYLVTGVLSFAVLAIVARNYGDEVIADWGLLALSASLAQLFELGFGIHAQKIVVHDESLAANGARLRSVVRSSGILYAPVVLAIIASVLLTGAMATPAGRYSILIAAPGIVLTLVARVYLAGLLSLGRGREVIGIELLYTTITWTVALLLTLKGLPLEGFALGLVAGGAWMMLSTRRRFPKPVQRAERVGPTEALRQLKRDVRAAAPYGALGILDSSREPLIRLSCVLVGGQVGLAAYTLGSKPGLAFRQFVSAGYLSFSAEAERIHQEGESVDAWINQRYLGIVSVVALLGAVGQLSIGIFTDIWLGSGNTDEIVNVAGLTLLWATTHLVNGPLYLARQMRNPRSVGVALAIEVLSMVLILGVALRQGIEIEQLLAGFVVSATILGVVLIGGVKLSVLSRVRLLVIFFLSLSIQVIVMKASG